MNGGSSIRTWRLDAAQPLQDAAAPLDLEAADILDEPAAELEDAMPGRWLLPTIAIALAGIWLAMCAWLAWGSVPALRGAAIVELLGAALAGPGLIALGWLLTQRSSRAEARRFGETAAAMRAEAERLERSIATLSAAIDTNRVKLADQAEALAAIGEGAADRLASVGAGFAGEVAHASDHAAALSDAAHGAQASVAALLDTLPRARAEQEQAAQQLNRVAAAALDHAEALEARVISLGARGREAEELARGAADELAKRLDAMEAGSALAGERLKATSAAMTGEVDALFGRTAYAVDEARKGIAAQGDAMLAMVQANQSAIDHAAREGTEALAERIASIEQAVERITDRLDEQRTAGNATLADMHDGIARVEQQLEALHAQGVERSGSLAASISALGGSADAMTEALKAGDAMGRQAIGTTESLLTAFDSAAREIDETLPDALGRLDARVGASRQVVAAAKPELLSLVTAAESTHEAIEAIAQVIAGQRTTLDHLSGSLLDTLSNGRARADALGAVVDETIARAHRFGDEAAPALLEGLLRVRDTAVAAADKAREAIGAVIPEAASRLEAASAEAMTRAAAGSVEARLKALAIAADAAAEAATRASDRLGERLQEMADNTALLEGRLEAVHAEREEGDRDTLARRVPLLIEGLNSASIDLAKSLSAEVSDTAWAAYLKGDRGVFTRRAVRLVEANEAREIARLYDSDSAFREQVNRYIHDFEAMLRAVLAQRDGSPLGVTLLSSDMGKLYVALAQAIERLR